MKWKQNILTRFVVIFLLIYGGIQAIGYTPLVESAYRNHYIAMTDKVFKDFKTEGIVKAALNTDEEEKELDVLIMLSSKDLYKEAIRSGTNVRIAKTFIFTKFLGYLPLSILLALILATPLHWKQKLIALISGLILVELFIIFRLWLHLMYSFNEYEWLNIVHLSSGQSSAINFLGAIFISNVVVVVMVPFLIWMLVAILPFPNSPITSRLNAVLVRSVTK